MPWKEMSVVEQKEEFVLLWKTGKYSVTELAEMFTISRPTVYKYINRYHVITGAKLQEIAGIKLQTPA